MQNAKGKNDIYDRTFEFACRIVRLHRAAARGATARPLLNQLLRPGTGIGANLEEAEAGQSKADFIAKARIALKEARELVAILTTIVRNASANPTRRG